MKRQENIVYDYKHALELRLKNIEASSISRANKNLIKEFCDYLSTTEDLSTGRILRHVTYIRVLFERFDLDYRKMKKDDIEKIVSAIKNSDIPLWSKEGQLVVIKKLFRAIKKCSPDDDYPPEVAWISYRIKDNGIRLPESIMTEEEILALIRAAITKRDKAFIAALYESGARIGELLPLRYKDITFNEYGCKLRLSGKTGDRIVQICSAANNLKDWINEYPSPLEPDSFIWIAQIGHFKGGKKDSKGTFDRDVKFKTTFMAHRRAMDILKQARERAGITKRVNPHSFRHARATFLANKMTAAQLKAFFGWKQSSAMADVYIHLSGSDTDDAILEVNGMKKKDDKSIISFKSCFRCGEKNSPDLRFCRKCNMPIDDDMKALIELISSEIASRFSAWKELDNLKSPQEYMAMKAKMEMLERAKGK